MLIFFMGMTFGAAISIFGMTWIINYYFEKAEKLEI